MDLVQDSRTLIAALRVDPLTEMVCVTIFMKGMRTVTARTEGLRVHPFEFGEAVNVALNAKFSIKAAQQG